MDDQSIQNTITLGGEEVPYELVYLPQVQLQFYPENPRIYSVVYTQEETPTQGEIEQALQQRDHVKQLSQSIVANGGLIDPLWVRKGDYLVLEGNSRLAAYRLLNSKDPIKWGKVKCALLPSNIDDQKIFAFLCQCHVIGRQDWAPYEQAGIIWRRNNLYGDSPQFMAKEMGVGVAEIKRLIEVYSFMDEHNDKQVQHWSYYFEYLKSRKIQTQRDAYPKLDGVVVSRIKSSEITRAEDIRDKLTKIAGTGGKPLEMFIEKHKSLDSCYEKAIETSEDSSLYRMLYKFRVKVGDLDTKKSLAKMSEANRNKSKFELKKIRQSVDRLLRVI